MFLLQRPRVFTSFSTASANRQISAVSDYGCIKGETKRDLLMTVSNLTMKTRNWSEPGWEMGRLLLSKNYQSSWNQDLVLLSLALSRRQLQCPSRQCSEVVFFSCYEGLSFLIFCFLLSLRVLISQELRWGSPEGKSARGMNTLAINKKKWRSVQ
jgi:hypothetical protein